jgi:putative acetyltransferase
MPITVSIESPRQADVLDLLQQSDDFAFSLYPADSCYLLDISELEAANVAVFVARVNDDAQVDAAQADMARGRASQVDAAVAGIAALVCRGDKSAELKRLFVAETARGRGVADSILHTLEEHAATSGIEVLRLETGHLQPATGTSPASASTSTTNSASVWRRRWPSAGMSADYAVTSASAAAEAARRSIRRSFAPSTR